jgi:hypothetical protein
MQRHRDTAVSAPKFEDSCRSIRLEESIQLLEVDGEMEFLARPLSVPEICLPVEIDALHARVLGVAIVG